MNFVFFCLVARVAADCLACRNAVPVPAHDCSLWSCTSILGGCVEAPVRAGERCASGPLIADGSEACACSSVGCLCVGEDQTAITKAPFMQTRATPAPTPLPFPPALTPPATVRTATTTSQTSTAALTSRPVLTTETETEAAGLTLPSDVGATATSAAVTTATTLATGASSTRISSSAQKIAPFSWLPIAIGVPVAAVVLIAVAVAVALVVRKRRRRPATSGVVDVAPQYGSVQMAVASARQSSEYDHGRLATSDAAPVYEHGRI